MNGDDEQELDLDLGLDDDAQPGEPLAASATPPPDAPTEPTDAEKYASLKKEFDELKNRPAPAPVLDTTAIANAIRDAAGNRGGNAPAHSPEQVAAMNQQIQEAMITDPFNTVKQIAESIANQKIQEMMQTQGTHVLGTAGETVLERYVSTRQRQAGDGGKRPHAAIADEFEKSISPQNRSSLATATAEQRKQFLDDRYDAAAGRVLLKTSGKARPRDLSAGGGGGAGQSTSAIVKFPGATERENRFLNALAAKNPKFKQSDLQRVAAEIDRGA